jgi:hypothetical protein
MAERKSQPMRVLNFRAWSKTHKKMLDRVLVGPGDPCSIVWSEERQDWVNFDEACGDIMQFTGLTDRLGKEIYEGDILGHPSRGPMLVEWGHLDNGDYESDCYGWVGNQDWHERIVIGNIYEDYEKVRGNHV